MEVIGSQKIANEDSKAKIRTFAEEWRFIAPLIVFILVLTSLPYVYAYTTSPSDKQFVGVLSGIPDQFQYFAWMRDLSRENLAPNRLTSEPNDPAFFNLLWWIAGRIGVVTGLDYAMVFQVIRIFGVIICLSSFYVFLKMIPFARKNIRLSFILFAFGGGLGVIWIIVKFLLSLPEAPFPLDIYTAEPNTLLIMQVFPHFTVALALIIMIFSSFLYSLKTGKYRYAILSGLIGASLGFQHAYDLITIYSVLGLFGLLVWIRGREFPLRIFYSGLITFLLSSPPVFYLSFMVLTDQAWSRKLEQFDNAGVFTPPLYHLPILLGIPLLLALFAFRPGMLRSRDDGELLIASWFLMHFLLIYLPVDFQIHMLLGWQVPISVLAAAAITKYIVPFVRRQRPSLVVPAMAVIITICVITNVYLQAWRFVYLSRYEPPNYISMDEEMALRWLDVHTTRNDVVLAALDFGQFVPARSDARAFLAHWAGTLDFFDKQAMVREVFDPAVSDARRREILSSYGVTYIVARERDQAAAALDPAVGRYLTVVFSEGNTTIYRVITANLPNG
ncbi:MAG: hypothetical protein NZ699_18545 [Roseiflexus sp.]|nr:hypothetical protein [Roseiflexus sp.]MCS7291122.1 hypothetical protein [Roseiflexus sp.]MDW8145868.1 hypothetical protein [Roseiflexaceae bacterium]MDW8232065.1 hypothetical protein [Roseiflexaceae bacterium]